MPASLGIRHRVIPLDFIGELLQVGPAQVGRRDSEGSLRGGVDEANRRAFSQWHHALHRRGFCGEPGGKRPGDRGPCRRPRDLSGLPRGIHASRWGTRFASALTRRSNCCGPSSRMTQGGHRGARAASCGVDFAQTWSCYVGGEMHCGECGTCVERREAFLLAGVPDPTAYLNTSSAAAASRRRSDGECSSRRSFIPSRARAN